MKKYILMGLLAALFVPAFVHAAAEPISSKPTLWIAAVADPVVLHDRHFPFQYFSDYVKGLAQARFNVKTTTLDGISIQYLRDGDHVLVTDLSYSEPSKIEDWMTKKIKEKSLVGFPHKTYVLIKSAWFGNELAEFSGRFRNLFDDNTFELSWQNRGKEKEEFVTTASSVRFKEFLQTLNQNDANVAAAGQRAPVRQISEVWQQRSRVFYEELLALSPDHANQYRYLIDDLIDEMQK